MTATTIPISTKTTIAACNQIHVGDIRCSLPAWASGATGLPGQALPPHSDANPT